MPNRFGTGSNSNGQFWYGNATNFPGFLYKKNVGVGARRSTKFTAGGNITTNCSCKGDVYLYNKWKPGAGGVGASSIANRRAKNRLATICNENKCFPCYMTLGQYSNYTHNPNGFIQCPPVIKNCIPNLLNVPIPSGSPVNNDSAQVLVLACIDPRFINALEEYLIQELGSLGFSYDLFTLAGASLGGNGGGICNYTNWQEVLFQHIEVALSLHNIQYIWIFDHLDCGAYKNCNVAGDDSLTAHNNQFTTLKNSIVANTFTLADSSTKNFLASDISGFVIPLDGCFLNMPAPNAPTTPPLCEYIPPSTGAHVLVLGCIDPRFQSILSSFLVNYKNVQFSYDLFILAGASLGANQSYISYPNTLRPAGQTAGTPYPVNQIAQWGEYWGPTFFDTLALAVQLHNITEVWVFDHLDCGAYKLIKFGNYAASDNTLPPHVEELTKLEGFIAQAVPTLGFKGFVADMNGNILKVVDNNKGIC
jgi:carbonic anhydrase